MALSSLCRTTVLACMLLALRQYTSAAPSTPPRPSAKQLAFQELHQAQFMHFSVCTFAGCEQNDPPVPPATTFAPTARVNTEQWVAVAQSWGARQICLTAHHSGGFALWQTNATEYVTSLSRLCPSGSICSSWLGPNLRELSGTECAIVLT